MATQRLLPARSFFACHRPPAVVNDEYTAFMQQSLVNSITTTLRYVPRGEQGTLQTLRLMAQYCRRDVVNTELRDLAHQILGQIPGHDFDGEIRALFNFVRDRITYRKDPVEVERVQDAIRTLHFRSGDCDDKTVLLVTLLMVCGHRARFCVAGNAPGAWTHVYCEVLTRRGWMPLDPTPETAQPGWETGAPAKGVFEISPTLSSNIRVVRATNSTNGSMRQRVEVTGRQARRVPASAFYLDYESGLGADTYEWTMNKGTGECELKKKSCGFFCKVGKGVKTAGKIAIGAAGAIAAPFTGGLSLVAQSAISGSIAAGQSIASRYMANAPAGAKVEEPKGECAAWLQRKQAEQARAEQENAARQREQPREDRGTEKGNNSGLLSQPLVIAAVVLAGAMILSKQQR